jgi:hypothetical protein
MTFLSDLKRVFLLSPDPGEEDDDDTGLRKDERDTAVLANKYPLEGVETERQSEYRLARLLQYPHY